MKTIKYVGALLAIVVLASFADFAEASQVVSEEKVLLGNGSALKASGFKGGEVTINTDSRSLRIDLPKLESGVTAKCHIGGTRDAIPYLGDKTAGVNILFRDAGTGLPESIYVVLEAYDFSTKPAVRKSIPTQTVATAQAENVSDGWKSLYLPFDKLELVEVEATPEKEKARNIRVDEGKSPDVTSDDSIEKVVIRGTSPGSFEVSKISMVRLRNVSVKLVNKESTNMSKLEIEGQTSEPSVEVKLDLIDGERQHHVKTVRSENGKYTFTWENPPLIVGKANFLHASAGSASDPLNKALPVKVAGIYQDTSHVWLSVKGRDIVTSPLSKGGSQPFYAVGVGYGRGVLVKNYDEDVAAYCKSTFLNTLRLAFYTSYFNGKKDAPVTFEDITAFIDPVVAAARRHSLYVILDDHSYFKNEIKEETARGEQASSGWTEQRFEAWVQRWVQVATYYKDEPYILGYELCNEPVCDPETAQKWYKRCIDAIREVDKRHIIIVGTSHWSHSRAMESTWSGIADKIDAPYNNTVFAFHDYPLDDNPWKVQEYLRAFQAKYNVPVMCTEFGGGGKPERVHREAQAGMLAVFAFDRIGWMVWSIYDDKTKAIDFPTRAIRNETDKTWQVQPGNPGYWIPFVELWAPTARIMGSPFPEPASSVNP